MNIRLIDSNKKIMFKQKLFIGNWDKSTAVGNNVDNNIPMNCLHGK